MLAAIAKSGITGMDSNALSIILMTVRNFSNLWGNSVITSSNWAMPTSPKISPPGFWIGSFEVLAQTNSPYSLETNSTLSTIHSRCLRMRRSFSSIAKATACGKKSSCRASVISDRFTHRSRVGAACLHVLQLQEVFGLQSVMGRSIDDKIGWGGFDHPACYRIQ